MSSSSKAEECSKAAESAVVFANALQKFFDGFRVKVDVVSAPLLLEELTPFFLKHEVALEAAVAVASANDGSEKHAMTLFAASLMLACLSAGINEKASVVARMFEHQLVDFLQAAASPTKREELIVTARAAIPDLVATLLGAMHRDESTQPGKKQVLQALGGLCSAFTRQRVLMYPRHLPAIIGGLRGIRESAFETIADMRAHLIKITERLGAIEDGRDASLEKIMVELKSAIDVGTSNVFDSVNDLMRHAVARATAAEQIAEAAENHVKTLEARLRVAERKVAAIDKTVATVVDRAVFSAMDGIADTMRNSITEEMSQKLHASIVDVMHTRIDRLEAARPAVDEALRVVAGRIDDSDTRVARAEAGLGRLDRCTEANFDQVSKLRWFIQTQLVAQWNANASAWSAFYNAFAPAAAPAPAQAAPAPPPAASIASNAPASAIATAATDSD